jgi:Holliday junction resolvase
MARKGYAEEYKVKNALKAQYGDTNVIKVAIGGAMDYFIAKNGKIELVLEVKGVHGKKKYFSGRERSQIDRIKAFAQEHNVRAEVWIVRPRQEIEKTLIWSPDGLQ